LTKWTPVTTPLPTVVQTFKALAHPARLRILAMLRPGELCGCQIAAVLDLSPSTVSAHLAELRRGGLIAERKEGRWVHYRLSDQPDATPILDQVWSGIRTDPTVRADAAVLRRLRAVDVAELCRLDLDLTELGITRPTFHAAGARA
jgi:ArsR family transcriptional regulator, arsenate/arsenite/antimonite-responsive transcriptional repressor